MTNIYFFCVASVIIYCVSSQFEDQYPPIFSGPTPHTPHVLEGNYKENPIYVFSISAWVVSPRLQVGIRTVQSEETSSMISRNCTPIQNYNVTCDVYLTAFVDRERTQRLVFKFFAYSSNTNAQIKYQSVVLTLDDINDESPVFDYPSYQILIPENYRVNNAVTGLNIKATDLDEGIGGQVHYTIMADDINSDYFDINEHSGVVVLKKELDYEKLTFLHYTIIAKDGGGDNQTHSSTAELLIRVENLQDKPPIFIGLPYVKYVPEYFFGEILHVRAIDGDGDLGTHRNVSYGLLNGPCAKYLRINKAGVITTTKILDRDNGEIKDVRGVCFVEIEAHEVGVALSNLTRSTTTFALTVEDINDNAPHFTKGKYKGRVAEDATIFISFDENIQVEDIDQNNHNEIQLTVLDQNMTVYNGIEILPASIIGKGMILLRVNKSFDYEAHTSVDLVLKAEDRQNRSLYSLCDVHIEIVDTNDNDPKFNSEDYEFYVLENSCNGTFVGIINAFDRDSGSFGQIFYHISETNNRFEINANSGEIFVAKDNGCNCTRTECDDSDLNWEKNPVFYLTAVAQDGGGRRSSVSVEIHLLNINDNAPKFRYSYYETSIKEDSTTFSSGKQQIFVQATDEDDIESTNSQISYCIVNENNICMNHTHFYIDQSGAVSCIKELDYEDLSIPSRINAEELRLKIKAFDHGTPPLYSIVDLKIFVQDKSNKNPNVNQTRKCFDEESTGNDHSQSTVFNNNCNEFPYIAGLSTLFITSIASGIACMLFMRKYHRLLKKMHSLQYTSITRTPLQQENNVKDDQQYEELRISDNVYHNIQLRN